MFERLKEIRIKSGETCATMAIVLGLKTRGAYHKKENGDVPFSLEDARKISLYFNKPIEDIFFKQEISYLDTEDAQFFHANRTS